MNTAKTVVEHAGLIALQSFRKRMPVVNKCFSGAFDPVTSADREVEAYLRATLHAEFPDYSILGEEGGESNAGAEKSWIIDPIDGTRAFISGMPTWGILVGLVDNGCVRLGVMHQPYLQETFVGTDSGAALYCKGTRENLNSSSIVSLEDAVLYCTHPDHFEQISQRKNFEKLADTCRMTRYGGDCYSYCLLAQGLIDIVVEGSLQTYDIVPLIPIIEGAGGVITDINGDSPMKGGLVVAAANRQLHSRVMSTMRNLD